jgi:GNAT superfamily N-acetyltransferase
MLAMNAAAQVFIASWVQSWRTTPQLQPPVHAATCMAGAARGLALHRDGPSFIADSHPAAARELAGDLADAGRSPGNVIGARAGCAAFADAWTARIGGTWRVAMQLRHHMLIEANDIVPAPGAMRPADADDLPWLTRHALAFAREARLPDSPRLVKASVARRFAANGFRIWTEVAPAAFAGCVDVGSDARIGMVYTLPERRGHGYATSLVASMVRERREAGVRRIFLSTDAANATSNAIYARIGFRAVSDEVQVDFVASEDTA